MLVDLRSDTVTRPVAAMRAAMANADVGDDVYGEDPTVQRLEHEVADILGKEAALFVPSGSMGNQIGLLVNTRPGDEVIVGDGAHLAWYESGAGAAIAGVQFLAIGRGGLFDANAVEAAAKPERDYHPRTRLVAVENTHNRGGGLVFPQAQVLAVAAAARKLGLALHLDGARLWNAAVATATEPSALAAPFDTVNVCFSKGLGAPAGSALAGSHETIRAARRFRKMLGGGMRQAGILAAGALYALEHHRGRLAEDHEHARLLRDGLRDIDGIEVPPVETNIVLLRLGTPVAMELAEALARRGVLAAPFERDVIRLVTHLDVSRASVLHATTQIQQVCREMFGGTRG